jgi:hypothetical protein
MPCMWNGKPVAGNKGSCPYGSTWVEPQSQAQEKGMFEKWNDQSLGMKALDVGSAALMFGGPLAWAGKGAIAGGKTLLKGGLMNSRTGKLMDKLFRKKGGKVFEGDKNVVPFKAPNKPFNQTTKGGLPIQPKFTQAPSNTSSGRVMRGLPSRNTMLGVGAIGGGMGLNYASNSDERATNLQALQAQQQQQAGTALDANTQALMAANATKAEADRVAGLNPLERMMENMKKKGFWTDPINEKGSRTDTKLNRLGILMDYYGKDPVQRAASISPSKQFAQSDKEYADTQAAYASAQQTLSSKYGKPTVSNLATGMYDMVKEAYGDTWMPFDEKGEDELKRISTMAANIFVELSQDPRFAGASEDALRQEAVIRAGEELQL